jgi:hypothetical protein
VLTACLTGSEPGDPHSGVGLRQEVCGASEPPGLSPSYWLVTQLSQLNLPANLLPTTRSGTLTNQVPYIGPCHGPAPSYLGALPRMHAASLWPLPEDPFDQGRLVRG